MKLNLNKRLGLAISTVVLLGILNSCVKNRNLAATDFTQNQPIVELVTGNPTSGVPAASKSLVLALGAPTATERIYVNYAALTTAPKDIAVTISLDQGGLSAFNLANSTNYTMLNTNAYTFNPIVIIPAGQQFGYVDIIFKPGLVNLAQTNALAIKITDASGVLISANYASFIYKVNVKSIYEGIYELRGFTLRAGDPVLTGPIGPVERTLLTQTANSVRMSENHLWSNAGGGSGIAAPFGNPWYAIDPVTNLVTVGSDAGFGPLPMLSNIPGRNSHYDPVTRTIYAYATWNAGPGQREFNDTLRFLRNTP